jgi:hypothetical protein
MAKTTSWQSQTKWLSDQTYYSPKRKDCIWTDRVSRFDRQPMVSDRELARQRAKKPDKHALAVYLVDKFMRSLPALVARRIEPRVKWQAVELLLCGQGVKAVELLRGA